MLLMTASIFKKVCDLSYLDFLSHPIHFKKMIESYPASTKLADATLKLGFAYYELGDREQARKTLNDVAARYPATAAARLATERLQKMKSEGR